MLLSDCCDYCVYVVLRMANYEKS